MNEQENINKKEKLDEVLREMNETSSNIHIHKTSDDGKEVDIGVDKKNKEVEINIDSNKGHEKVNVNFSGVHIKGEDGEEVKVQFLPWIIFGVGIALAVISLVLYTIYNIFKLFV